MGTEYRNNGIEECLIHKIQKGDECAFEDLFKEYYFQLTRFSWRYVHSKAVAEELVQEVFTEIWEKRERLCFHGSIRSYLYKAAKNQSLNYLKHQKIKNKYDSEWMNQKENEHNEHMEIVDRSREDQIKKAIQEAIEELPPRSKMTYKLNRYDGLTYPEIAEVMDVSIKTVESQMTRTLKTLRVRLAYLLPVLLAML